ncbi:DUF397 domain-containing protein [Actinoallomurus sp. NPDC052274]|uniref:DUF397 domain-containing protein n=1 Tax=Actinoallomurus sp. NPDC052274 TaxID=3155420 RepID=UPI003449AE38
MTTSYSPKPSWRTSSYSADQGGTCVQVAAVWRTSSHSGEQGGECVQVAVVRPGLSGR